MYLVVNRPRPPDRIAEQVEQPDVSRGGHPLRRMRRGQGDHRHRTVRSGVQVCGHAIRQSHAIDEVSILRSPRQHGCGVLLKYKPSERALQGPQPGHNPGPTGRQSSPSSHLHASFLRRPGPPSALPLSPPVNRPSPDRCVGVSPPPGRSGLAFIPQPNHFRLKCW